MCDHEWKLYQGLREEFAYCTTCGEATHPKSIISLALKNTSVLPSAPDRFEQYKSVMIGNPEDTFFGVNRTFSLPALRNKADRRDKSYSSGEWVKLGAGSVRLKQK
jgi:hypothetical protein